MSALAARLALPLTSDYRRRWALVAACLAVSLLGLSFLQVAPAFTQSLLLFGKLAGAFVLAGLALSLARGTVPRLTAGFFLALGQHVAFITASIALPTIAAAFDRPLLDATFTRWDWWLGFDWSAAAAWVAAHPTAQALLVFAYGSMFWQTLACVFVYSLRASGEFLWLFAVTLLAVIAVSLFFPALGQPGMIGQEHIDVLLAARAGSASAVSGIITFPSFHSALAVLFIYASRINARAFAVALPLNLLLLAATPVCGGHYLVDTIAGAGVSLLVILGAQALQALRIRR
jgi:PAP2 superfamily